MCRFRFPSRSPRTSPTCLACLQELQARSPLHNPLAEGQGDNSLPSQYRKPLSRRNLLRPNAPVGVACDAERARGSSNQEPAPRIKRNSTKGHMASSAGSQNARVLLACSRRDLSTSRIERSRGGLAVSLQAGLRREAPAPMIIKSNRLTLTPLSYVDFLFVSCS